MLWGKGKLLVVCFQEFIEESWLLPLALLFSTVRIQRAAGVGVKEQNLIWMALKRNASLLFYQCALFLGFFSRLHDLWKPDTLLFSVRSTRQDLSVHLMWRLIAAGPAGSARILCETTSQAFLSLKFWGSHAHKSSHVVCLSAVTRKSCLSLLVSFTKVWQKE